MSSFLVAAVLLLLLICVLLMAYNMYSLSGAKKYEFDGTGNARTVKTEGVEAFQYWKDNKMILVAPTVCNVLAMVMLGLMYVIG